MARSQRGPVAKRKASNIDPINLVSSEGEAESADDFERRASKLQKGSSCLCPDLYNKACKCKKDNPFCLSGLIPAPGGHRKKGLWLKDSKALLTQGANPADQLREVHYSCQYLKMCRSTTLHSRNNDWSQDLGFDLARIVCRGHFLVGYAIWGTPAM